VTSKVCIASQKTAEKYATNSHHYSHQINPPTLRTGRCPRNPEPAKRWEAFLSNHREGIAAMDFFSVPTLTFGVLYCFFVILHDRQRILHCNVTEHPTSAWVVQHLREAFPFISTSRVTGMMLCLKDQRQTEERGCPDAYLSRTARPPSSWKSRRPRYLAGGP